MWLRIRLNHHLSGQRPSLSPQQRPKFERVWREIETSSESRRAGDGLPFGRCGKPGNGTNRGLMPSPGLIFRVTGLALERQDRFREPNRGVGGRRPTKTVHFIAVKCVSASVKKMGTDKINIKPCFLKKIQS
jgi:hypothetical protein